MKIAFCAIFDPNLDSYFGPKKSQIWNSLNRILIFNLLERQKLYYYQVCNLIFTISSNKHLHTYISVICWKSIYCYWSFCPRGHWDPGCVSNWFVYLSTISFVYLMSLVRLLVSGWLSFWLAHHFVYFSMPCSLIPHHH